ncbi:LBP/BPI/CETP family, carboxy-terminal domain protein (macronuclear) [Tetrahymena thermophila SB210]|uniref:LBP/BPI/CETP family, carboxy-terminal domain protein n=1 Tax=Tetrahymena thermophila (strain SB210) TaxID=312017 RepID=Q24BD6_TETTS|nr:LBP/BPI/CETP family, carboxy-terminal domain protein [Tetrahymena thermophila SB210]EAS05093.2 LBP/BPI/CETP family, carboxy-terminal domain protein [Tetrahymena thermophila SB210]|eukprot:XP_001025338.2 LBP/BPI/CETP family, carboxy-terminal domain protein [Tetrahymena thermophila SB210]
MKSAKNALFMAFVIAITIQFSHGWIYTHYNPPQTDIFGPASKTYLTMQAFTDLILQNMVFHQFNPDYKNIPIASMDRAISGIPVQFQLYMHESKVDSQQTTINQTNNTYVINCKNVSFKLHLHLTVNGKIFDIPATTDNAEFSIFFQLLFNEQGLIYVNSTKAEVQINSYMIPAGFFDAGLDQNIALMEVQLPHEFMRVPPDAIMYTIKFSFENQLTDILRSWLADISVYSNISLDRNFTSLPYMAGDKIVFERNMYFYNSLVPKARPNIPPPTVFPSRDNLCHKQEDTLMMNEYFFNSLFYAMHDANMLQFTLNNNNLPIESKQKLTVYQIDNLIPGLKQKFIQDYPMTITFKTLSHPMTSILGEVFLFREPKVMTKVELEMNLFVDIPTQGQVLIAAFQIVSHVELSMRIDINQLFLYFEGVQITNFKKSKQGFNENEIQIDENRVKNAIQRVFLQSIPRLTNFLMLSHGIQLMPFQNVELINSKTDIAPNHISTQTDLQIFQITKNPFQSFPAMVLRVQNRFLDRLKDEFLERLIPQVKAIYVGNKEVGNWQGIKFEIQNFRIPQFSIDIANTDFRGNEQGNFNIHISHFIIEPVLTFHAEKVIDFWLFKEKLEASVGVDLVPKINDFDANVKIDLDQNGQIQATLQNININWDFKLQLKVGGLFQWLADIIDWVLNDTFVHRILVDILASVVKDSLKKIIENQLTQALQKIYFINLGNGISLDIHQTASPIVNSQFIEFQSAFFFFPSDQYERPPFSQPVLPDFSSNSNDIEMMIHEYSLNSAGYFAFTQRKLDLIITYEMFQKSDNFNFTAEVFKWTLPAVQRKFGKDAKMNLGIESLFYPSIKIKSNELSASIAVLLDLQVRKPQFDSDGNQLEDEQITVITIDSELDISAKVYEEKQILKFSIENFSFSRLEAFGGEVEPGIIFKIFGHSTVNKILNMAIPFINEYLFANNGIDLNQILVQNLKISNIQISLNEGFIYVGTDADIV